MNKKNKIKGQYYPKEIGLCWCHLTKNDNKKSNKLVGNKNK